MAGVPHRRRRIDPRRAMQRVGWSALVGFGAWLVTSWELPGPAPALIGWDAGSLLLLALCWAVILPADAESTRDRAGSEDPGRTIVYVVVVLTSAASLLSATMVVRQARSLPPDLAHVVAGLCLSTVALAWLVTHTAYTLRYARLYYREDREGVGGLDLPGHAPPTYFDFAYFAFTIGMCFQVSDACITSAQIRRTALVHAVISFAYNTVLIAFVLNLVFSLAN
jgi:uncharacterized membrane protein